LQILDECEASPQIRGIIFSSGLKRNVFTAGNDLNSLYAPLTTAEAYAQFWRISNVFLARLYGSPLVTVAAIKGACPAGGCCLAMCCDYRVVNVDGKLGLNEVAIGISVPEMWIKLMISIIGQGRADKLVQFARFVTAREALALGLVDEVANTPEELLPKAHKIISSMLKLPDGGRQITKSLLRNALVNEWINEKRLKEESTNGWGFLSRDDTVKAMGGVLASLSKNKAKL